MKLQVFCYALSQNDGSEWRQRIQSEAEHFIDVSAMSSDMIARMINEDKIHILINQNGYTKVFADLFRKNSLVAWLHASINLQGNHIFDPYIIIL